MIDSDNLKFLPRARFIRERQVMLIADCPLDTEIKVKSSFSSQSAASMFSELNKVGCLRGYIHAAYMLAFRPEKGDISAVFHQKGLPFEGYEHWPESPKSYILSYVMRELEVLRDEIRAVKPSLIILTGKWSLYFLTGQYNLTKTVKSNYGSLLTWRGSHLQLSSWWGYDRPHVVIPILPAMASWQMPDKEVIIKQDYKRVGVLAKAAISGNIADYISREENFVIGTDIKAIRAWLSEVLLQLEKGPMPLTFDCETRSGYMDCIGIAKSKSEAICIPFSTEESPLFWPEAQELEIISMLYEVMLHPNCLHRGQNYSYDQQYFYRNLGMSVELHQDTMIMHHTLFPGMEKALDFLASIYCSVYRYWGEASQAKGQDRWIYNCRDVCHTHEIADVLEATYKAAESNVREAYFFQQYKAQPAILELMKRGVNVDAAKKETLYRELISIMEEIKEVFCYALEEDFNINSGQQMQALFYDLFRLPVQRNRDTNQPSLDDEAMNALRDSCDPLLRHFIDLALEFRSLKVFSSTFLAAKIDIDGRMRTSYNVTGTDTFRLSSSKDAFGSGLNLQNVPKGGKTSLGRELPNVRSLYVPDPGMTFFDIDLDSADLRIVVAESGAKDLQQMLDEGRKPYIEMMKEYYHDPGKNKNSPEYKIFKGFAHGSNYLGSAAGLAGRLGLLVHEVDKLQKWYFSRNPEIAKWHTELKKQVMQRGWIENVFGYRRYFFNKREPTLFQIAAAWKPQCLSGRHTVLTSKGLIPIAEVTTETLVATWDIRTQDITWEKPLVVHKGIGAITKLTGSIELEATAEHRIPFHTGDNTTNRVRLLRDLPRQARIPLSGYLASVGENWPPAKGALLAAFQGDGWFDVKRNSLQFELSKERKILRLRELLTELGIIYTESVVRQGTGRSSTCFYIPNASSIFSPEMKESGPFLLNIGGAALMSYVQDIKNWDGHWNEKLGIVEFCSARKSHVDYLKLAVHLCGGRAREYAPDMRGSKPLYRLNFSFSKVNAGLQYANRIQLPEQEVFCLTTRTGFFLTELDGCISVTGNSTVGILINHGMVNIRENEPDIQVLLQVHDSLAGQFPTNKPYLVDHIKAQCAVPLPYEKPIVIPVGIATSELSWGECG